LCFRGVCERERSWIDALERGGGGGGCPHTDSPYVCGRTSVHCSGAALEGEHVILHSEDENEEEEEEEEEEEDQEALLQQEEAVDSKLDGSDLMDQDSMRHADLNTKHLNVADLVSGVSPLSTLIGCN
jgi:hypothetical protein